MCAQGRAPGCAGNANLPAAAGGFRDANREIGVPGSKTDFQAGTNANWRRHSSSREEAGEIEDVDLVGQVVPFDFERDVFSLFVEHVSAGSCIE